jgi:hypothetical protein
LSLGAQLFSCSRQHAYSPSSRRSPTGLAARSLTPTQINLIRPHTLGSVPYHLNERCCPPAIPNEAGLAAGNEFVKNHGTLI